MSPACLCAACPAQVSLTSERVAESSAAGEGGSWVSGWGGDAQGVSANAARLGRLRDTQRECSADLGRGFSTLQGAVPGECSPFLAGSLTWGVGLCAGGSLSCGWQRGHTVVRRMCLLQELPWASLDHSLWKNTPLAAWLLHCNHPAVGGFLAEMSRQCLGTWESVWSTGAWCWIAGASKELFHGMWNLVNQCESCSLT